MKKLIKSILVLLFQFGLAFASLPLRSKTSRMNGTNTEALRSNKSLNSNEQSIDTTSTAENPLDSTDIEAKNKYQQLQVTYQTSLVEWNAGQEQRDNIQKEKIRLEERIDALITTKQDAVTFEPREWISSDGKFKTIGTLISSDFKIARIRKDDGIVIEVSKEKLSDADKQAIERAFAAIEVANKKNEYRQKQIKDIREKIKESVDRIKSLQIDKPVEPTFEDANRVLMAEMETKAKAGWSKENDDPSVLDSKFVEILDTRVTAHVNSVGVPFDVIETKFKNIGTEAVRVIDVEYSVSDANGKIVLKEPYTLFVALDKDSGLKPGESRQTKEDGFHLPKNLLAKSAKTVVKKVQSFKRIDTSKVGNDGKGSSRDYVPSGINFISSREDPRTPGDFMHVFWSDKKPLDLNELIVFCQTFREKEAADGFTYLVVFDAKENAAYPQNPYTALYGVDLDIMEHIRFYYECNKGNGYSRLTFVKDRPPSGAANSIVIP
jgi:hypothetical protein